MSERVKKLTRRQFLEMAVAGTAAYNLIVTACELKRLPGYVYDSLIASIPLIRGTCSFVGSLTFGMNSILSPSLTLILSNSLTTAMFGPPPR